MQPCAEQASTPGLWSTLCDFLTVWVWGGQSSAARPLRTFSWGWAFMKTTGPALLHYFSFNRYDFLPCAGHDFRWWESGSDGDAVPALMETTGKGTRHEGAGRSRMLMAVGAVMLCHFLWRGQSGLLGRKALWAEARRTRGTDPVALRARKQTDRRKSGREGLDTGLGSLRWMMGSHPDTRSDLIQWTLNLRSWRMDRNKRETCRKAAVRPGVAWWMAEAGDEVGGRGRRESRQCHCCEYTQSTTTRLPLCQQPEFSFLRPCSSIWEILAVKHLSGAICNSFSSLWPEGREKRGAWSPGFNSPGPQLTAVLIMMVLHRFRRGKTHTKTTEC